MKAIRVKSIDEIEVDPAEKKPKRPPPKALTVDIVPRPEVKDEEVLIKVHTAGVNRPDVLQRLGLYPPPVGHSGVLGLEVSGTIVDMGKNVSAFEKGDSVCALANGGGYAEYCSVPFGQCLPVPKSIDMITAGCIPETFFTVWHNLFQQVNVFGESLQSGQSLLVHGGSSGIGMTAIQMARAMGIKVFATAGSLEKCKACEDAGAEVAINYRNEDFAEHILSLTDNKGVNLVLDMVAGSYLPKNLQVLQMNGRIAVIGSLGGVQAEFSMRDLMRRRLTIGGSTLRGRDDTVKVW